ncbi:hypothetical protein SCHPADRAFT_892010 [Schizopora paradoxa]|uniref:Uncharacterized protein n=1 Tax=Schizopora paradoxa TaxID=27342 RepID=A0A0H2RGA6_9AGAM|nr:hypothetical protein SCHPADRAFT_892010 [Schizopora paradoxa]
MNRGNSVPNSPFPTKWARFPGNGPISGAAEHGLTGLSRNFGFGRAACDRDQVHPDDTGLMASRMPEIQQSAATFPSASLLPTSGPGPNVRESIDARRVIEEDPRNTPKPYQDTPPSASGTVSHASNPHLQSIVGSETPTQAFPLAGHDHYQPPQGSPSEMSRTSSPEDYTAAGSPTSDNLDLTPYQSGSSSSAGWGVISTLSDGRQNVFTSGNVQMFRGICSIMAPAEDHHQDETSTSFAILSDDGQSNPQLEVPEIQRYTQSPNPDYAEWLRAITENSEDDAFNSFRLGGAQASLSTESVKNEFDFDFSMGTGDSHAFDDGV